MDIKIKDMYLIWITIAELLTRTLIKGSCVINHLRIGPGFYVEKCIHGSDYVKVCNSKWDDNEARVACRGEGHCTDESCDVDSYDFIQSNGTVRTEMRRCNGEEEKLNKCTPILPNNLHNCSGKAFHVKCHLQEKTPTPLPNRSDLAGIVIGTLIGIVVMAIVLSFTFSVIRRRCTGQV